MIHLSKNKIGDFDSGIALLYHFVGAENENPFVQKHIHRVNEENFYYQLKSIKKKFDFVFIDELMKRETNRKSTKSLCSVTFDDGYQSIIETALPILHDLNIPSTLFLTESLVKKRSFWRDKIRFLISNDLQENFILFLNKNGCEFAKHLSADNFYKSSKSRLVNSMELEKFIDLFFRELQINTDNLRKDLYIESTNLKKSRWIQVGNHTSNHYLLSSLNQEQQNQEILGGKKFIQEIGLESSSLFSLPFGGANSFNKTTIQIVKSHGYKGFLLSSGYRPQLISYKNKYGLPALNRMMPENKNEIIFPSKRTLKDRLSNLWKWR